jgi:hypothetical protein
LIYETVKSDKIIVDETRATLLGINAERCTNAIRFIIQRQITAIYLLKFVLKTIAAAILIGNKKIFFINFHRLIEFRLCYGSYSHIHIISY